MSDIDHTFVSYPNILRHRFIKISAERYLDSKQSKTAKGALKAETHFDVSPIVDRKVNVEGVVTILGESGKKKEFAIEVRMIAEFGISAEMADVKTLSDSAVHVLTAQIGPILVIKCREVMSDLGYEGSTLTFFNPFEIRHIEDERDFTK